MPPSETILPAGRVDAPENIVVAKIAFWREVLGLDHWTIRVAVLNPADTNDNFAQVRRRYQSRTADIQVADPPPNWDSDLDATIVHELLHLAMADYDWMLDNSQLVNISDDASPVVDRQRELLVDELARAIVRAYRLGLAADRTNPPAP